MDVKLVSMGEIVFVMFLVISFNNSINYESTGLLIIDEEHKFGIKQKNFIKDKQSNVHVLYLSATPIPLSLIHI